MENGDTKDPQANIVVVGSSTMQNELLVSFLHSQTELNCSNCSPSDLPKMLKKEPDMITLFLIDAQNTDLYVLLNIFDMENETINDMFLIAAYNMDPDIAIDLKAIDRGLQGVFYKNEPLDNITKGIQSILTGDYWYSRKSLSKYVWQQRATSKLKGELSEELTAREKEVLLKIYAGACNKEIAEDLCISFHTVKTHVYNIFRKLQVNNRFQATLWAAKNL